jgi:hypothetical protein
VKVKYWCNTHRRTAKDEYPNHVGYACPPGEEGGWIMIPCDVIDFDEVGIELIIEAEDQDDEGNQSCQWVLPIQKHKNKK